MGGQREKKIRGGFFFDRVIERRKGWMEGYMINRVMYHRLLFNLWRRKGCGGRGH